MGKTYVAEESDELSSKYEKRYVIVDTETRKVLDDAQGYGYRTPQNAYSAYGYKFRDKSKDAAKKAKTREVHKWCKENKDFVSTLEQVSFEICKGSWGPDDKFDAKLVKALLKEAGFKDLPFTPGELLKYGVYKTSNS
ncbi:MAG: hypothetical protein LBL96_05360 [Clostridiales bacterium]|nr:hypothetical protein [Clostridiales bacterium]